MKAKRTPAWKNHTLIIVLFSVVIMAALLYISNTWTVQSAHDSTEEAVHSVSDFYLQELAGRREQVIASTLNSYVENTYIGLSGIEKITVHQTRSHRTGSRQMPAAD